MRGGHYVSYVRASEKSRGKTEKENSGSIWYHASDAYVREASLDEVLRCEAYILFYEKIWDRSISIRIKFSQIQFGGLASAPPPPIEERKWESSGECTTSNYPLYLDDTHFFDMSL